MIQSCFIARLRKLDKGELCPFFRLLLSLGEGFVFFLSTGLFGVLFSFRPPTMG